MATKVTIGELRERVTIQQPSVAATQARTVTWSSLAIVWANVSPAAASERIQAAAMGAAHDYRVTIRYRGDVTPTMRIAWTPYDGSAKTLQIHGVQPLDGARAFLVLTCGEVI